MKLDYIRGLAIGSALIVAPVAPTFATVPAAAAHHDAPDEQAGKALVQSFYGRVDSRTAPRVDRVFTPDAGIVLADGRTLDPNEFQKAIAGDSNSGVRNRLGNFEYAGGGEALVVAFDRTTSFTHSGEGAVVNKFRESWFLKKTPAGWRSFWVNYVPYDSRKPYILPTRPSAKSGDRPTLPGDEEPAMKLIEDFFVAYGKKDGGIPIRAMFLPRGKIVHMVGVEQSADAVAIDLEKSTFKEPKFPRPKPAPFDNFAFRRAGDYILASFDNHVSHWRDGHPEIEHAFRENWLFKKTNDGMKVAWVSYSLYGAQAPNIAKVGGGAK